MNRHVGKLYVNLHKSRLSFLYIYIKKHVDLEESIIIIIIIIIIIFS